MLTILDALAHIAKDLHRYSGADDISAVDEFLAGSTFDFDLAITPDVAKAEFNFVSTFGVGHSYSFPLDSYAHGKEMLSHLYWVIRGEYPDMSFFTGEYILNSDRLFLFMHIRSLSPVPIISNNLSAGRFSSKVPVPFSRVFIN